MANKMADNRGGKSKGRTTNRKPATRRSPHSASSPVVCHCKICEEVINEPKKAEGDDSVFCNGLCTGWIHRRCAGLSLSKFKAISETEDPFFCPSCCSAKNEEEITALKSTVQKLESNLLRLQTVVDNLAPKSIRTDNANQTESKSDVSTDPTAITVSDPSNDTRLQSQERKPNIVIYGIAESNKGTPMRTRVSNDFEAAINALQPLNPSVSEHSIRDCTRLGKYIPTNPKPRPLLVSLNNSYQVSKILANRSKLASTNLTIKPHMSKLERLIESMLLKERRRLINNKTPSKHIRIQRNKLLVSGQVHAQVSVINDKCQLDFVIHGEIVQTPPRANQPLPPDQSPLPSDQEVQLNPQVTSQ